MNEKNITESLGIIRDLNDEIFKIKERIREKKADLIYMHQCEENAYSAKIQELKQANAALKQERSIMISYQNKATLDSIQDQDPKLFNLIKRYQSLHQDHQMLKSALLESDSQKKHYLSQYSSVIKNLTAEEKQRVQHKGLEFECAAKQKNIETLRNVLVKLKQSLLFPSVYNKDLKRLISIYDNIKRERNECVIQIERIILEDSEIGETIKNLEKSSKRRNSIYSHLEDIENINCLIGKITEHTQELEDKKEEIIEKCVGINEFRRKKIKGVDSGQNTERNFIIKQVGKELEKGKSQRAISVLKSYSKPGTPAPTKLVQLNRSNFIHRNLL